MKIELILVQYLYNHKELTLQGIGTFHVDENVTLPADTEKEISIPANAITFRYNPKVTEDDQLIDFIVANTKKIKPLASADLDSFLMLGRQFLNIGKPFIFEGIGTLHRANDGGLVFVPGQFINARIDVPKNLSEGEHVEENVNFHEYGSQQTGNNKKPVMVALALVLIAAISWAVWYFGFKNKAATENVEQTQQVVPAMDTTRPDTITTNLPLSDSISGSQNAADRYTFRIVFKVTDDKQSAQASMTKLNSWGHKVIMYTEDSVNYKLAELFSLPLADTARVRDSIQRFYKASVMVEAK